MWLLKIFQRKSDSLVLSGCHSKVQKLFFQSCLDGDLKKIRKIASENGSKQFINSIAEGFLVSGNSFERCQSLSGQCGVLGVMCAIYADKPIVARMLFEEFDVNPKSRINDSWNSALIHKAAVYNRSEIVSIILEKGEDSNVKDNNGDACINKVVCLHNKHSTEQMISETLRIIEILATYGANLNYDNNSTTPILDAADSDGLLVRLKNQGERKDHYSSSDFELDPTCPALRIIAKLMDLGATQSGKFAQFPKTLEEFLRERFHLISHSSGSTYNELMNSKFFNERKPLELAEVQSRDLEQNRLLSRIQALNFCHFFFFNSFFTAPFNTGSSFVITFQIISSS